MQSHEIYSYWDGTKTRFADPIAVERVLTAYCGGDPKLLASQVESQSPDEACRATEQLKRATCAAFNLTPFDAETGAGVGEDTLRDVLANFFTWREKKNLTTEVSPTSLHSSEPTPLQPVGGWNEIFRSLMDCGCS